MNENGSGSRLPMLVNLGCGSVWHPAWVNLDVRPVGPEVQSWDVENGLPFDDGAVDGCYASHLLEHLPIEGARRLLRECLRVLRSGGVVRLAVPDLEAIAREYLRVLAHARTGDPAAVKQYEWITLELLDQLVRVESGGEMGRYLRSLASSQNVDYVTSRIGCEAASYFKQDGKSLGPSSPSHRNSSNNSTGQRFQHTFTALQERLVTGVCSLLIGRRGRSAVQEGLFRASGECHRWMYDQFSLKQLLEQCGFCDIRRCTAFDSRMVTFDSYNLDVVSGDVRKPDSLFMEAVRP